MLMLGNLFRESGVVRQLTDTASNALMYVVVILLGTSVGATTSAEAFLNLDTLKIVAFWDFSAFAFGTAAGVLFGKLIDVVTHGKGQSSDWISRCIRSAYGSQSFSEGRCRSGSYELPVDACYGTQLAGVIGTAVAAGTFMAIFGVF